MSNFSSFVSFPSSKILVDVFRSYLMFILFPCQLISYNVKVSFHILRKMFKYKKLIARSDFLFKFSYWWEKICDISNVLSLLMFYIAFIIIYKTCRWIKHLTSKSKYFRNRSILFRNIYEINKCIQLEKAVLGSLMT